MSIPTRKPVTVPADGVIEPVHVAGRVVYVEESPANTPDGVPTFHLVNGGDGIPLYSRSALAWLPSFRRFWIKGTAAAAGLTIHLLVYDDPCAEGIYSDRSVISGNPCADCPEPASLVSPTAYEKLLICYDAGTDTRLSTADFDGANENTLVGNLSGASTIEDLIGWDETLDRIYYMPIGGPCVESIAADGSGSPANVVLGDATSCRGTMDKANRVLYFGRKGGAAGEVCKFELATSTLTVIYSSASSEGVAVVYDPTRNVVYAGFQGSDIIRRMNPDGTGVVDLHAATSWHDDLVLDEFNGHLYWLEDDGSNGRNALMRLDLGTLVATELVAGVTTNSSIGHLSLRLETQHIYIADRNGRTLTRYALDGTDPVEIDSIATGNYFCSMPIERVYV